MTTLNETSDYFKIMEKRLAELEKKNAMQEKTICELRMENEEMKEKLEEQHIQQHMDTSDSMKRPEKVSVLSIECILRYIDSRKRILLSFHYPQFERIEKMIPLELGTLTITKSSITIDGSDYHFVNEGTVCSMKRSGTFDVSVTGSVVSEKSIAAITRMVFRFFSARRNIQVDDFMNEIKMPFNLDIHAELIELNDSTESTIENYEGLVQSADSVFLQCPCKSQDLTSSWIRKAKYLVLFNGGCQKFLSELPNIQNETVEVELSDYVHNLVPLIMKYCENRNRKIGSRLILSVKANLRNYVLNAVFDSAELYIYGFQWIFRAVFRYPIENNSEIRITVGKTILERFDIHLDVVPSTSPASNPDHFFNPPRSVWNF